MRRVLMVSFQFPPIGGPGVQRISKFVKYLPRYGWQPHVLAMDAGQVPGHQLDDSLLAGIPSEAVVERMTMGGPMWSLQRASDWLGRRQWGRALARGVLLPDVQALWGRAALKEGIRLIRQHRLEAIYTTDPPSTHWAGYHLQRHTGLPWVMDIRDLWTGNFTYRPVTFVHGLLDSRLERRLILSARAISCVTHGFKRKLTAQYRDADPDKFVVITNGYDEADFSNLPVPAPTGKFTLAYVGTLYDFAVRPRPSGWKRLFEPLAKGNGPPQMVRTPRYLLTAVRDLIAENPKLADRIRVLFVGVFPPQNRALVEQLGLEEVVETTGHLPHREAIRHMADADVLFLMQAGRGSEVVVPGKLYEYLRAGRAILGLFPQGEAPAIIRAARAGRVIAPDDVVGIRQQMGEWFKLWLAGKPLIEPNWDVIRTYTRERQTAELAALLDRITG